MVDSVDSSGVEGSDSSVDVNTVNSDAVESVAGSDAVKSSDASGGSAAVSVGSGSVAASEDVSAPAVVTETVQPVVVEPVVKENFWRTNFDLSEPEKKPLLVISTALNLLSLFALIVWAFPPSVFLGFAGGVTAIIALSSREKPRGLAVMNIVCGGLLSLLPLVIICLLVMVAGSMFTAGVFS